MLITNVINKNVDVLYCFLCNCVYRKQSVTLLSVVCCLVYVRVE